MAHLVHLPLPCYVPIMRRLFIVPLLLALNTGAGAFSITPVPGSGDSGSLPQFVAAGVGGSTAANPFFGSGTLASMSRLTLAPEAYRGPFQLQSGQFLFGAESFTARPGWTMIGTGPSSVRASA